MNKVILCAFVGFLTNCILLTGCMTVEKEQKIQEEKVVKQYKCPMKCSDQVFDKPGKCPNCGMELVQVTEG